MWPDPHTEPRTPTDEERAAFKRQEREAAAAIMAGDRYCPDPSVHGRATPRADAPPPLDRAPTYLDVSVALNEAWLSSNDAYGHPRPPDLARHLHRELRARLREQQEGEEHD